MMMCIGNDELSAAVLLDALTEDLAVIHVIPPGAGANSTTVSPSQLHVHGFTDGEAALPSTRRRTRRTACSPSSSCSRRSSASCP